MAARRVAATCFILSSSGLGRDWIRTVCGSSEPGCSQQEPFRTDLGSGRRSEPQKQPPRLQLQLMFISLMYTFVNHQLFSVPHIVSQTVPL